METFPGFGKLCDKKFQEFLQSRLKFYENLANDVKKFSNRYEDLQSDEIYHTNFPRVNSFRELKLS
jgi:hypothetical protein